MARRSSAPAGSGAVQVSALMSRLIVGVGDPLVLENDRELVHQEADPDRALGGVLNRPRTPHGGCVCGTRPA